MPRSGRFFLLLGRPRGRPLDGAIVGERSIFFPTPALIAVPCITVATVDPAVKTGLLSPVGRVEADRDRATRGPGRRNPPFPDTLVRACITYKLTNRGPSFSELAGYGFASNGPTDLRTYPPKICRE